MLALSDFFLAYASALKVNKSASALKLALYMFFSAFKIAALHFDVAIPGTNECLLMESQVNEYQIRSQNRFQIYEHINKRCSGYSG